MLDSITLLCAVGEIREDKVLDTIRALHLLDDQPQQHHKNRKMWRIVLIAAIIAALLIACAVVYSIHQRRQQELRAAHEVEAKHVDAWVDYEVPGFAAAVPTEPTLTLLSTYNDGVFLKVFVNASPIEPDEVVTLVEQDQLDDGWWHWMQYRYSVQGGEYSNEMYPYSAEKPAYNSDDYQSNTGEDEPGVQIDNEGTTVKAEAYIREMKQKSYDPATKTLFLSCHMPLEWIDPDKPVTLDLVLWDQWQRCKRYDYSKDIEKHGEIRRPLGSVTFDLPSPKFCTVCFDDPPVFANDERGKTGSILSVDISATQIVWHLTHEEWDDESFEVSLSWINCIDRVLQSAKLNYADGTSLSCGGMVAAPTVNGEIEVVSYHTMDGVGQTVIDVHELASVTVAGKTYPLPSIIDSQN